MTNEELSNEFDILINNINTGLEFDEYEKSMFLTKAQEDIVTSLYRGNLIGESFERTEELRRYLSDLVNTYDTSEKLECDGITNNSYFFKIPDDVLFITYEAVVSQDEKLGCSKNTTMEVVPVTQDEFHRIRNNPFRMPNKRRVLRLDIQNQIVELVSYYEIDKYIIRYLKRPDPIILTDLPQGLSINKDELTKATECKLNPAIHRMILDVAVNMAIKSRVPSTGK